MRGGDGEKQDELIRKKLMKFGYEHDVEKLLSLTSLMTLMTYGNRAAHDLLARRNNRILRPWLMMPRVASAYDLNSYVGERMLRNRENQTREKRSLLRKKLIDSEHNADPQPHVEAESFNSTRPSAIPEHSLQKNAKRVLSRGDGRLERGATKKSLQEVIASAGSPEDHEAMLWEIEKQGQLARDDALVLPETSHNRTQGFTFRFVQTVNGLSGFPTVRIANLAATDFLREPKLMVGCYLELGAAMGKLARSGVLSLSSSKALNEVNPTPTPRLYPTPSHQ